MCKILEDLKTLLLFQYSMYLHFLVQNWRIKSTFFPYNNKQRFIHVQNSPTRKLNPSRGQMWFYLRKVLRLWGLILLMTNPLRNRHWLFLSIHFSVLTGYNKKIVLFISSFLLPQNILHIFSTEILPNNKHFLWWI